MSALLESSSRLIPWHLWRALLAACTLAPVACGTQPGTEQQGPAPTPSTSATHASREDTPQPPIREPAVPTAPPMTPRSPPTTAAHPPMGGHPTTTGSSPETRTTGSTAPSPAGTPGSTTPLPEVTPSETTSSGATTDEPTGDVGSTTDADTSTASSPSEPSTSGDEQTTTAVSEATETGGCPHAGTLEYRLNGVESWPAEVVQLLTQAMDEAIYYYNCYADLRHELTVNYDGSVPTAQANVDGWITFGSNRSYMVVATAMHEVAHTLGVGFYPWNELLQDGRWSGPVVNALMASIPESERDPEFGLRDYITADGQHFWPYGLNYASEHLSEWSLINHVRVVAAMQRDKENYLGSR